MGVKSDIEIAQEAQMLDIREVAAKVGVAEDDLELMVSIRQRFLMIYIQNLKIKRWKAYPCNSN